MTIEYICPAPVAVCQDIDVYLDATGSATILDDDLDGGSTAVCGISSYSASQTTFDCGDIGAGASMVITTVYDGPLGTGYPKGCGVYVIQDIPDLSVYGLGFANNGGGTDGIEFTFPAVSATAGQYIYVSYDSAGFADFFGFAADYYDIDANINGDDAVELYKDGALIDVFGDVDVDGTGTAWEYMDGWAYRNNMTGPDGAFVLANWSFSGPNALDGETTNATAATPVPIGTYAPAATGSGVPVTLTVTDASGGTGVCIAYVNVIDTLPPVMSCTTAPTVILDAAGSGSITYADIDDGTMDNCGVDSMYLSSDTFDCSDIGSVSVTLYAVDLSGNIDSCTSSVTVDGSSVITPAIDLVADASCYGYSDGAIDISLTGGSGTYLFDWDNDGTGDTDDTEDLSGLAAGTYNLDVVDDNGCMGSAVATVNEPAAIDITVTQTGATLTANATGVTYQWYDCDAMSNIAGQTVQDFTATSDGNYACIITDGSCVDTTACTAINGVGVATNVALVFSVYPNPASDQVKILLPPSTTETNIRLLTLSGKVLVERTATTSVLLIDIADLAEGVYLLQLTNANSSGVERLVVRR